MGRVVVIGATGHIGTYLVPRLVDAGHEVIALSRGTRGPYHSAPRPSRRRRPAASSRICRLNAHAQSDSAEPASGDGAAATAGAGTPPGRFSVIQLSIRSHQPNSHCTCSS
jgi:nucleoside-diphosphate-sugar epimerase